MHESDLQSGFCVATPDASTEHFGGFLIEKVQHHPDGQGSHLLQSLFSGQWPLKVFSAKGCNIVVDVNLWVSVTLYIHTNGLRKRLWSMLVEVYVTVIQNIGEFVGLSYPSMLPSLLFILHRCHFTNTTDHSLCVYVGRLTPLHVALNKL